MQKFYKGRTNNHLTWVMVDATDFATPESALSAATKIKIYGKLRGQAAANFVSSGAGSLTNDIQHVGASATGIYTIALVKADLSDASAAWYDQYVISLSATGAAYQTLIVDGGIDDSVLSALVSDIHSAVLIAQSAASDAANAAAQANSRVLLVQSRLSDLDSRLTSDVSDILSGITALSGLVSDTHSAAGVGNSRILLVQSRLSDFDSRLVSDVSDIRSMLTALSDAISDAHSDLASKIGGITASVSASDISDIASAVYAILASDVSDLLSRTTQINSRVLLNQSRISDIASYLVVMSGVQSDIYSALSDAHSDLASRIGGITASVSASDISDIASAVWAHTIGARVDSRVLVTLSTVSDIRSHVSDLQSDFQSRVPKRVATDSQLSDVHSDLRSQIGGITVSLDASNISDIASAVVAALPITSLVSDAHSAATQANSRILVVQSRLSDLDSRLVSDLSDVLSQLTVVQSMASDAASAATQANSRVLLVQSRISDAQSYLVAMSGVQSDIYSLLSDVESNFSSRIPKRVATDSQLSAALSDVISAIAAGVPMDASSMSDLRSAITAAVGSDLSDLLSRTTQINSRVLVTQSQASDIYSLLSDVHSDVGVLSGVVSDVYSGLSDFVSDFGSALAEPVTAPTATPTIKQAMAWLHALSRNKVTQTATVQSLRNDGDSADIASAAVSDDGTTFTRSEWGN